MEQEKLEQDKFEQTKYEFGNLRIVIEEPVRVAAQEMGLVADEIYRLIESFGNKLLMTKAEGEIDFTNKDTGASLKLDMQWEDEMSAVVYAKELTLKEVRRTAA